MKHLTLQEIHEYSCGLPVDETEEHLRICAECRSRLISYQNLDKLLHKISPDPVSPNFVERVMKKIDMRSPPSLSWMILKNLAPLFALTLIIGIVFFALQLSGSLEGSQVQTTGSASRSMYDPIGGGISGGVSALNGWIAKYFSFPLAKDKYGLAAFLIAFFLIVALLDRYLLSPMIKRRLTSSPYKLR